MKLNEVKTNIQNLNSLLDKLHAKQNESIKKPMQSIPIVNNTPFHYSKTIMKSDSHPVVNPLSNMNK
jgi:hypothetical protein